MIQYAARKGVIVVEAAGNGAEDLDDPFYDAPAEGFPRTWVNPLRRAVDSGVLLVGAGAPPPGTHGRDVHGPDRSRLEFSNDGSIVDAQGWGREATTTGYGDLQEATEHRAYTDLFSGTSSASPVVVGVLCARAGRPPRVVAGAPHGAAGARAAPRPRLPAARPPRRSRGEDAFIGARPDLRQMIAALDAPVAPSDLRSCVWLATDWTRGPANSTPSPRAPPRATGWSSSVFGVGDGRRARFVTGVDVRAGEPFAWLLAAREDGAAPDLHAVDLRASEGGRVTVRVLSADDGYGSVREVLRAPLAELRDVARRAATGGELLAFWDERDGEVALYALREGPLGLVVTRRDRA